MQRISHLKTYPIWSFDKPFRLVFFITGIIFTLVFTLASCNSRPMQSSAKINGKFELIDNNANKGGNLSGVESLNDQTRFERIVAVALGQDKKGSNLEIPVQFSIDFKGKKLVLSINLKKKVGDSLKGKHTFMKQLTETNFSYIIDGQTYLAEFGYCEVEKIRFGKKGHIKGRFLAEFAGGFFSGEFHAIIDENFSSYQG